MEAHTISHHEGDISFFRCCYQFKTFDFCIGKRFLHEDVLACGDTVHADGMVQVMRKAQQKGINIIIDAPIVCG